MTPSVTFGITPTLHDACGLKRAHDAVDVTCVLFNGQRNPAAGGGDAMENLASVIFVRRKLGEKQD